MNTAESAERKNISSVNLEQRICFGLKAKINDCVTNMIELHEAQLTESGLQEEDEQIPA